VITEGGGNATATNAGNNQGGLVAETTLGGNAVAVNSGTSFGVATAATGGNATTINSGTSIGGLAAATLAGNATSRDCKLWRLVHQSGLELRLSHSAQLQHSHDAAAERALCRWLARRLQRERL
jgi:hypothetical protein